MFDKNRLYVKDFDMLLEACEGDYDKAMEVYLILKRSYRGERNQVYKRNKNRMVRIGGEVTFLKFSRTRKGEAA